MDTGGTSVIVFAEKELHSFYRAFVSGMESARVLTCPGKPDAAPCSHSELVIIDCGFRTRQGLGLLKTIKEKSPGTMVIIINEKSSEEAVIEAFQSGARYYLRKPIDIAMLRRISKNLLKVKKESEERRLPYVDDGKPRQGSYEEILRGKPTNLIRAVHFMEDNLGSPLDLETCAREGHLSKYQFCRSFKQHFGESPMNFVNSMRIDRAKELLKREDLNITEVALYVGFKDHGTFIKAFKKRTGLLPSEFKKSLKNGPGA